MAHEPALLDELLDGSSPKVHASAPRVRAELAGLMAAHAAGADGATTLRPRRRRRALVTGVVAALAVGGGATGAAAAPHLAALFIDTAEPFALTVPADVVPGLRNCRVSFEVYGFDEAGKADARAANEVLARIDPADLDLAPYLKQAADNDADVGGVLLEGRPTVRASFTGEVDSTGPIRIAMGDSEDQAPSGLSPEELRDRRIATAAIQDAVESRFRNLVTGQGIEDAHLMFVNSTDCGVAT